MKYIENSGHVCDYGCGLKAHYQFKNGKWCCELYVNRCPIERKKILKRIIKKPYYIENSGHICKWCGQEAHYQFQTGNWCCENHINKCPTNRTNLKMKHIGTTILKPVYIENSGHVCKFCEKKAFYHFQNGDWCCEDHSSKCPSERKRNIESNTYNLKDYQKKYPLLFLVEELKEDSITGEIQGHCKNHNCPNSKEMGGWFTLEKIQISDRALCLRDEIGNSHFYCSNHCKKTCSIYGKTTEQIMKQDLINSGHIEENESSIPGYGIWRDEVIKRVKEEYGELQCEYCGNTNKDELCVHHEKPQKTHPEQVLDPINGWVLCSFGKGNNCHLLIGHPKGSDCSNGNLTKLICERKYRK